MSRTITLPAEHPPAVEPYLLDAELNFYQGYAWCLNPFPSVRETVEHLKLEIDKLGKVREDWQAGEVMTNVFLLSCALLNAADDYLRGKTIRVPKKLAAVPLARTATWAVEKVGAVLRWRRRARVRVWRDGWLAGLDAFLSVFVAGGPADPAALATAGDSLAALLRSPLPSDLQAESIYFPSAFRRLDLTHFDVLALGRHFATRFPDRGQPLLLLGLRTAGSYFAPLLRAFLKAEGYRAVAILTVQPEKGLGARERAELTRCAAAGCMAIILDDPPHTGDTIVLAVEMARKAGFAPAKVAALLPAHPGSQDWSKPLSLSGTAVLTLGPEEWHKHRLLCPEVVEGRLADYFQRRHFSSACVSSAAADQWNARLQDGSEDPRRARLKRVYEVRLQSAGGEEETRYVLAKSVGWGWLGYHAFLAGHRLAGFVPPVLGLRDGVLYTEWLPQRPLADPAGEDRERWVEATACYVAARARSLSLGKGPEPGVGPHRHHEGVRLLEKVLSRAYGGPVTAALARPRVRRRLCALPCPLPTLVDGKMHPSEWVAGPRGPLKTDYEHHGMGKNELNVLDPAYDLAEALLHLGTSPEEEERLVRRYAEESGDPGVGPRLFLNKFLAGSWAMASALRCLFAHAQPARRQQELHQQFVRAWHFLTVHTARLCGGYCRPPQAPRWRSPLVVLDIDGVLDGRTFGFPCTTAAGVEALSLLHAHEFAVAVDTARSAAEVKEYCRAYGLVGGVAEYGGYVWDAVGQRGRALVSPEPLRQLARAREALARLPGVFVDDRYQYSVRAFTYEDKAAALSSLPIPRALRSVLYATSESTLPVPLPTLTVRQVLAELGLDRLCVQQTTIDTTVLAREVDKGSGLSALLNWVGLADADTTAVGDSAPDLPMFCAARRCFAPAQISCARQARLLGCRIARRPGQRGLLEIVRSLVPTGGGRRASRGGPWRGDEGLFLDLLRAADRRRPVAFLRALFDPRAYRMFVR
jgi:hydroxymethylpyrimidine pyrophosphatase-like HAD family hydrolase